MRDVYIKRAFEGVVEREDGLEEDPDYDGQTILDNIYVPNLFFSF